MRTVIKGEGNLLLFLMLRICSTCVIGCFYRFLIHFYQFDPSVTYHSPAHQKPCKTKKTDYSIKQPVQHPDIPLFPFYSFYYMREILFLCTHIYAFLPHALSRYENIGKNPTSSSFLLQDTKTEDTNQLLLIHIP